MTRDYYVMDDQNPTGMHKIRREDAGDYNERRFGIFWTVNDFGGDRRIRHNLKKINSWFVECDDEPKAMQIARIEKGPLEPSLIVESKRGYQIYFHARNATPETWREIMGRVRHYYNGDPRAKDLTRTLRVPGYYHWKDATDPFLVTKSAQWDVRYTEAMMIRAFPAVPAKKDFIISVRPIVPRPQGSSDDFWSRVYNFNSLEALTRLSGSSWVRYDKYEFRRQSNGNHNIISNGKMTSCFVDSQGRIGSSDKGGPTIWQWLRWYGHPDKAIAECLKVEIPELWT